MRKPAWKWRRLTAATGNERACPGEGANRPAVREIERRDVHGIRRGVADYALDPEKATALWQLSADLLATPLPS
jgi:hypothetical protein